MHNYMHNLKVTALHQNLGIYRVRFYFRTINRKTSTPILAYNPTMFSKHIRIFAPAPQAPNHLTVFNFVSAEDAP